MAIDTILPADTSIIAFGDSFSFVVDDTYTSMVIQAVTESSTESVYDSASGGVQTGYTVSVTNAASRDTFTVSRDAGWDTSPQAIHVTEDESGTSTLTSFSYTLTSEFDYPQGTFPYNPVQIGTLNVTEDDVAREEFTSWMDFDPTHFNVTSLGGGKVNVDTDITTYPTEIFLDSVSVATHGESLSFNESLVVVEDTADNFSVYNRARNLSLTSHGSETCQMLAEFDTGAIVDGAGNHTYTTSGTVATIGAGMIPGTRCGQHTEINGNSFVTDTGTAFQYGTGEAFSVYGMFNYHEQSQTSPTLFRAGAVGAWDYGLYLNATQRRIYYTDTTGGAVDSGVWAPRDMWFFAGFTRNASDDVKIYVNGVMVKEQTGRTSGAMNGTAFYFGSANGANSYWTTGMFQNIKIVDDVLTDAQMLSECRRMFGR